MLLLEDKQQTLIAMEANEQERKKLYLEYIRKAYERISTQQQNSGTTRWAVLAAVAYLFWQSVPNLAKIKEDNSVWSLLVLLSAHFTLIVFHLHFMYQNVARSGKQSPYDTRQEVGNDGFKLPLIFSVTFFSFGPTALLSGLAWHMSSGLDELHYKYLSAASLMFIIIILMMTVFAFYLAWYLKNNKFMPPMVFSSVKSGVVSGFFSFGLPLFFVFASSYYSVLTIRLIPTSLFEPIILLSGTISVIFPLAEVLLSSISQKNREQTLLKLERDIVIHHLSADQIRIRLEEDLIGSEIGDWAKRQIDEVRMLHAQQLAYCDEIEEALLQVKELDISLKFEREGRLRGCMEKLNSGFSELEKKWDPLYKWMDSLKKQPFVEPYVAQIIQSASTDIRTLIKDATKKTRDSLSAIDLELKRSAA